MKEIVYSKGKFLNIIYSEFGTRWWRISDISLVFEKLRYNVITMKVSRYHRLHLLDRKPNKPLYRISEIGIRLYINP